MGAMVQRDFLKGLLDGAEYLDISPRISQRLGVFPGDTPFEHSIMMDFASGDHLKLSRISTTVHLGAHADAPSHYSANPTAADIADVSLQRYLGKCEVIGVSSARGATLGVSDLPSGFRPRTPRVLFATGSFPDPDHWNADFCGLSAELIHYLAAAGVFLVGIDTPSIDPQDSKTLDAHAAVAEHSMSILEGLVLHHVPAGFYDLIALPLPIESSDASPVRAILIRVQESLSNK
jgi:arylformamidase